MVCSRAMVGCISNRYGCAAAQFLHPPSPPRLDRKGPCSSSFSFAMSAIISSHRLHQSRKNLHLLLTLRSIVEISPLFLLLNPTQGMVTDIATVSVVDVCFLHIIMVTDIHEYLSLLVLVASRTVKRNVYVTVTLCTQSSHVALFQNLISETRIAVIT